MKAIRTAVLAAAVLGGVLAMTPAASADPAPAPARTDTVRSEGVPTPAYQEKGQKQLTAAAEDGNFWVYEHPYRGGRGCGYPDDWSNYASSGPCGNMDNIASSVYNQGYLDYYDDVVMWSEAYSRGVYMCLGHGDYWQDFTLGRERFSDGSLPDNRLSSHYWTTTCG
ncbi:hypothetical protein [Nonomuraea sp. NPDC050783]|uniref:hypothetical protein n=1 Tax=Nonomuraea sp. NPDC050783 TaxID=3154634 RepID=UPI0034657155